MRQFHCFLSLGVARFVIKRWMAVGRAAKKQKKDFNLSHFIELFWIVEKFATLNLIKVVFFSIFYFPRIYIASVHLELDLGSFPLDNLKTWICK